jgi:hypothetical protein
MTITLLLVGILIAVVIFVVGTGYTKARERAAMARGDYAKGFVFVNEDGSIRDLTPEEAAFLNREFDPFDSGRPYVKAGYASRTPDGRLAGFLPRSEVPLTRRWK